MLTCVAHTSQDSISISKDTNQEMISVLYAEITMASSLQALCVFAIFFMQLVSVTSAQPDIWYSDCSAAGNYSSNSIYKYNLNKLLSSLVSNDENEINYGFYNISEGQNTDEVNAIALCRGDRDSSVCRSCFNASIHDLPQRCPNAKEAIIWYEDCMLRYSNRSIFNSDESQPSYPWAWSTTVSDPAQFSQALNSLLSKLKDDAASGDSTIKFASGQVAVKLSQSLFAYVQCTPDLSKVDCGNCLDRSFNLIADFYGASGGGNVAPSCSYRYETFKFYDTQSAQAPLAPPHPTDWPAPTPTGVMSAKAGNGGVSWRTIAGIIVPTGLAFLAISMLLFCFICRKRKGKYNAVSKENDSTSDILTAQSLQFNLQTIEAATNNFSLQNKIGEGGFGNVYEGVLLDGQRVAVKRLSRSSGQGVEEFKNEIVLIAKLQHRNLVRLLGFCLDGGEKILVYEFVPNKSLNYILFDPEKRGKLNWSTRYKIIQGIARGLLYLHQDSQLRIIHRDLKASNILLDDEMYPKISDFGMARIFGQDESQAMTNRIVGTYGYMSPEYAMLGKFSIKSDVYSFGVLVLEIVTGMRNSTFNQSDGAEDLLSHAWKQWCNGTPLEIMDPTLEDSYSRNEVIRSIHVGLLCVQEGLVDRPTMASIVLMLNSFSVTMQKPQEPARFFRSGVEPTAQMKSLESEQSVIYSQTSMITDVYPR